MTKAAYTFTGTQEGAKVKFEDGREVRVDLLNDGYAHLSVSRPINGIKCTTGMSLSHAARATATLCLASSLDVDAMKQLRQHVSKLIELREEKGNQVEIYVWPDCSWLYKTEYCEAEHRYKGEDFFSLFVEEGSEEADVFRTVLKELRRRYE